MLPQGPPNSQAEGLVGAQEPPGQALVQTVEEPPRLGAP